VFKLHYHVQVAKSKLRKGKASDDEGLLSFDDLSQSFDASSSSTPFGSCAEAASTPSPLSDNSSPLSSPPAQQVVQVDQPIIKRRKSSKQVSEANAAANVFLTADYHCRFSKAFKEGTKLLHEQKHGTDLEHPAFGFTSVTDLVSKLNSTFELTGAKKLSKSTLH
jgi:hypothetical protein